MVDPDIALNKVGHNLHWLHPVFKSVSFGRKVQNLCQTLKLEDPVILQSMYIYKNPGIGSEGNCDILKIRYIYKLINNL